MREQTLHVNSPYDNQLIAELPLIDADEAEKRLQLAHTTFVARDKWLSPFERINILEKYWRLLAQHKETLALLAATEGGKPLTDSLIEVERAITGIKTAIAYLPQLVGKEIPMNLSPSSAHRLAYTYREPIGTILAISAFNHPINLIIHQVIPAITVGCPVLIKPASSTPLSCLRLIELLYEAGLPEAWCQPLICHSALVEAMVSDGRISFLSFIGSSRVGWHLRSKLAPGANCTLEHGGAAPVIIMDDADIEEAIPLLVKGGFYHAGQVCVSVQRIFVHQKIVKTFAKKFAHAAKSLKVGDPRDIATEVGPLISEAELKRVDSWVKEAVQQGATLLTGGEATSKSCYAPTVLLDPSPKINISKEEIFGPVVCIYSFKDRQDAINQANKVPYIFQAAIFSKNIDIILDTIKHIQATTVLVNDQTAFRVDWMPFGGRKHSGLGVGGIPYTMEEMTYEKMFIIRSPTL